jgi:hypothetical protein
MPSVRARPHLLARPQDFVLWLAFGLSLVGGFGLGLYLLLGFALPYRLPLNTSALIQAHGTVQAFGLVPLFVLAVGTRLFPKFHDAPLDHPRQVSLGGLLIAVGVALRGVSQPAPAAPWRSAALMVGALLVLGGILLALEALGRVARRGRPEPRGRGLLAASAGGSLLGAAALNVTAALNLAQGGSVVPIGLDEAFLHLALWGFGAGMVLLVGGRIFDTLLLLRTERTWLVRAYQVAWVVGTFGVPAAWLLAPDWPLARSIAYGAQLLGVLGFAACLRLFEGPRAASRLAITRSMRSWARLAFGFLAVSAALAVALPLTEALNGAAPAGTAFSAARHALAQGFLLPVMAFMGARTLPRFAARTLRHPRLLRAIMAALFFGAALRVIGELLGGYGAGWSLAVAVGGVLGTLGFATFALGVWTAPGRGLKPAVTRVVGSTDHPGTRGEAARAQAP